MSVPPRLPAGTVLNPDVEIHEDLAELEHERWNAQRRMDGWRWADLPRKDEARRLHPNLVTYAALDEQTKDYDRAIVMETLAICQE